MDRALGSSRSIALDFTNRRAARSVLQHRLLARLGRLWLGWLSATALGCAGQSMGQPEPSASASIDAGAPLARLPAELAAGTSSAAGPARAASTMAPAGMPSPAGAAGASTTRGPAAAGAAGSSTPTVATVPTDTPSATNTAGTAAAAEAIIAYDRSDLEHLDPFPDDYFLVDDASKPTGRRVQIPTPRTSLALQIVLQAAIAPTRELDGMSPLAPIVVALPASLDPASVPQRAEDSLDAHASIGLFDVDPASPERGQRVPFYALQRAGMDPNGATARSLLIFPAHPLRGRGHYAFVITRGARTVDGRNLRPSDYLQRILRGAAATEAERKLAASLRSMLTTLETSGAPVRGSDIALMLGLSIRSTDHIADDLLAIRTQLMAASPPALRIDKVTPPEPADGAVAAVVSGTWWPASYRDGDFLARDPLGRPAARGVQPIEFTLALPRAALSGPVPMIMYQHGQPGSAQAEIPRIAQQSLADEGFAVIGFTDLADREIIPDGNIANLNLQLFATLLTTQRLPDYLSVLSVAEQLAFLRVIPQLKDLDVLPLGQPDGRPDLDPSQPLGYLGISQGASHGLGLLPFAPEIRSAALVTGAGRFGALLVHQGADTLYETLSQLLPDVTHAQLYTAIALVQMAFDEQDPQNLARFMFSEPLALGTGARANVLMTEGLGDSLVPIYATRSAAWQLGLPQLLKAAERVGSLPSASAPLHCDPTMGTRGAFYQYVATEYPGLQPTPGCVGRDHGEGHACAQSAAEALQQRRVFFKTALSNSPQIIDPLP